MRKHPARMLCWQGVLLSNVHAEAALVGVGLSQPSGIHAKPARAFALDRSRSLRTSPNTSTFPEQNPFHALGPTANSALGAGLDRVISKIHTLEQTPLMPTAYSTEEAPASIGATLSWCLMGPVDRTSDQTTVKKRHSNAVPIISQHHRSAR